MCVVSNVGDHYNDGWMPKPRITPTIPPFDFDEIFPKVPNRKDIIEEPEKATKEDLDALRKEVLEMKELLKKAIAYDKANNEPHCEMEEKVALLKKVAEIVGVSLDDVFGTQQVKEKV